MSLVGSGAFYRAIGSLVRVIAVLGTTILLVRMLDPSSYGVLALGFAAVGLTAAFTTLGLGPATTRSIAASIAEGDAEAVQGVFRGLEAWVIASGTAGLLVLILLVMVTQPQFTPAERLIVGAGMGGMLFGRNAAVAVEALARGASQLRWMEVPTVFGGVLQLGSIAALFASGSGSVEHVAIALGAVGASTALVSLWVARHIDLAATRSPRRYGRAAVKLARMAGPYAVAGIAGIAAADLGIIVLGFTGSNAEVGTYEPVLRTIGRVLALVPLLFVVAFVPAATTLFTRGELRAYANLYLSVSKFSFVVTLPAVLAFAIAPTALFEAIFGAGFAVSSEIVWLVLIAAVVELAFGFNRGALIAAGDRQLLLRASMVSLTIVVALVAVLIPLLGAKGAALSAVGSSIALNASMTWALHKSTGVHPFHRNQVLVVITSPIALVIGLVIQSIFGHDTLSVALFATFLSWLAWVVGLYMLTAVRLEDALQLLPRRWFSRSS